MAKKVLCYGDSNTRGKYPFLKKRYQAHERRTGILQDFLGEKFEVIEEGLNGRTTDQDEYGNPMKNGLRYFLPCIRTHLPLDYIILMLGTNNLRNHYQQTGEEITHSFIGYYNSIEESVEHYSLSMPKVILISPARISTDRLKKNSDMALDAEQKSKLLSSLYKKQAEEYGRYFFDAAQVVGFGADDGVHFSLDQHKLLGESLSRYLLTI